MNKKTKNPRRGSSRAERPRFWTRFTIQGKLGPSVLLAVILGLSLLAGIRLDPPTRIYVAGEVAHKDVTAVDDLLLEEKDATKRKREEVAKAQPPVFDLSLEPLRNLRQVAQETRESLLATSPEDLEQLRWQVSERLDREISLRDLFIWRTEQFAEDFDSYVLPWLQAALAEGVVDNRRSLTPHRNGILVRNLADSSESLRTGLAEVRDLERLREDFESFLRNDLSKPLRFRKAVMSLVEPLLAPSLTLNQEATQNAKRAAMEAVEPVYTQVTKGEIIVRQGERVSLDAQRKMQALFFHQKERFAPKQAAGVFFISALIVLGLYLRTMEVKTSPVNQSEAVLLGSVAMVFGLAAKSVDVLADPLAQGIVLVDLNPDLMPLLLPVPGAMGLLAMFFPSQLSLFAGLLISFLCGQLAGGGLGLTMYYFLTGMFAVFCIRRATNRFALLASLAPLSVALLASWFGVAMLEGSNMTTFWGGAVMALGCSVVSLFTILACSPVAEYTFGFTSRFKLMELMNLEQPLLRELMVNAPGTYHHSLVVANMVESGARAIGANPLLAKCAALYHDIGKLDKPQYFIENQFGQSNLHDKLRPSMSALILISHAKKGVELAREHSLGPEITEIIQQHHGTSLMSYFFRKAQEQAQTKGGEPPREEDYRYPGPKPTTKEAGLILLADVVEASSRTLIDPTHSRLKGHISKMIKNVYDEGQLDDSELTLRDMGQLTDAFLRILTGIFHNRIEYPEDSGTTRHVPSRETTTVRQ